MPAHILQRVGRYEDAAEANRNGVAAHLAYYAAMKPLDYYVMYTAHNYQFLAFSAAMEGHEAETIETARQSRALVSDDMVLSMRGFDWQVAELYAAMVRFGMWDEILARACAEPETYGLDRRLFIRGGDRIRRQGPYRPGRAAARRTRKARRCARRERPGERLEHVLAVAILDAKARIALAEGKTDDSIGLLREAVAQEDKLAYSEPADWFFPNRHLLGAVLVKAGRAAEAEAVYRDDLERNPSNGWALYGLAQSLQLQGRDAEAAATQQQFDAAWKNADVVLTASAF